MTNELTILSQTAVSAVFTVANATDIFTSAAHGLSDNDVITVANSGGALPTGLSASTYYHIITATTNTFQVSVSRGGSAVDMSDDGSGTNTWYKEGASNVIDVSSFSTAVVTINTSGSANVTLKVAGAISDTSPIFYNPQSTTYRYDNLDVIDLQDQASINGDTGLALAASDDQRAFQVNVKGLKWLTVRTLDFQAGTLLVKIKLL